MTVWREQAMKFTVTSGAGFTEVVDRPESARAALEQVLVLLARKRNDVRIWSLSKATPPHISYRSIGVILSRPSPVLTHHRHLAPSDTGIRWRNRR